MSSSGTPYATIARTLVGWNQLTPQVIHDWRKLLDRAGANVTLGPDWIGIVAQSFGDRDRLRVYLEHHDESLVTVVPHLVTSKRTLGIPLIVLQLASNRASYHAEFLTELDIEPTLSRFLSSTGRWDIFNAGNVLAGSPSAEAVKGWGATNGAVVQENPGEESPFLPIQADWASYIASKPKKFRYKLRRAEEQFAPGGHFQLRRLEAANDAADMLDAVMTVEKHSWKARLGLDIPSNPQESQYYHELVPHLAAARMLVGNALYLEGRPIAYSLCAQYGCWVGQLKTAFDERFQESSPGAIVIQASVRRAFELRASEFDFLGHLDQHKRAWTTQTRAHAHYFVYAGGYVSRGIGTLKKLKRRFIRNKPNLPLRPEET